MTDAVVFGAQGQLGHRLVETLKARNKDVIGFSRQEADITNTAQVHDIFNDCQPRTVYNAAAYNAVDRAESEPDEAMAINAYGPGLLAAFARKHNATLVHFSTDFVFGDHHTEPIDEGHTPAPLSVYGRSKYLGEQLVLRNCPRSFVIRCCGLYDVRRHNFVRTMLRVALMGKTLKVVDDQMVSPTWVVPLSQMAVALAERNSQSVLYGTYHAVAHGQCSWHEFAAKIFELTGVDPDLHATTQSEWGAPAARPTYSVLDNALLRLMGLDHMTAWDEMLAEFLDAHGQTIMDEERAKLEG